MTRKTTVFINGFGRIGRTVLRQILSIHASQDIVVAGINDIAPRETCAYLFRYDSVYGPFAGQVDEDPKGLVIDGAHIPFFNVSDLRQIDLSGVDIVLECTGRAQTAEIAGAGLAAGAASVLISGPSPAAEVTVVLGANEGELGDARIVSNASCTTNAIAPLLNMLDQAWGVERAHITTVHCYTGSQPTVDQPTANLERSRAAAVSMVPTSTSAAHQVTQVLPGFEDKLSVAAVRVPCLSVSGVDATLQLAHPPSGDMVDALAELAEASPLIGVTRDPCVSTDFRARPESLVLALPETQRVGPSQLRVFGWYDNEWGFSARMLDMIGRMTRR